MPTSTYSCANIYLQLCQHLPEAVLHLPEAVLHLSKTAKLLTVAMLYLTAAVLYLTVAVLYLYEAVNFVLVFIVHYFLFFPPFYYCPALELCPIFTELTST